MNKEALNKLVKVLGEENVLTSKEDLLCYSYDAAADIELESPDAVVIPENKDQVADIVKIASEYKIPLYTRGAGTNLSGGAIPVKKGIVVSMLNMNHIIEIDEENLTARVQPGVVIQSLLDEVEKYGLMYPPDPGTVKTATMGGSVAECAGGLRGLKYGVTKDYIMSLEVVLADGNIVNYGGKTVKNVSGYNLVSLFIGSEGTLGIITEILVKLVPIPSHKISMMAVYKDLNKAAETVSKIIANKIIPSTIEIIDKVTVNTIEDYLKIGLPIDAEAILLIEVDGIKEAVTYEADKVKDICTECEAAEIQTAKSEEERDRLWEARRAALPALVRLKPTTILEDATVPRSHIPDMIKIIRQIADKYNIMIGTFGHAGDGNLHPTILTNENNPEEMERVHKAIDEIFYSALDLGGTLSGEHGIGLAKAKYLNKQFNEAEINMFKKIKNVFDPENILNPGKILA